MPEALNIPDLVVTAVGSMPHNDSISAVQLILQSLKNAPHIPQLSKSDLREQMWIQSTENLPRFVVDIENLKYYFDTSGDYNADIEQFYAEYLAIMDGGPADYFAISPEYGAGIHLLKQSLENSKEKKRVIKVQATGPISFAMTITDQNGKAIFYDDTFRDIAIKGMGLKAAWLIEQFRDFADSVIVFFDEPCLSAYGSSAYMGLSRNDVIDALNDVIGIAESRGGIAGVHCCGNTDWGLLMDSNTRIINFDAVDYMHTMPLYIEQLSRFLESGILAWGAVPNDERIATDSFESVKNRINAGLDLLANAGVNRELLTAKMLVTPACGCAGLTIEQAELVYNLLKQLDNLSMNELVQK